MLKVERAHEELGAIVSGIDVAALDDDDWQRIYQVWLDHSLLVVRGQRLSIEQFLAWGRRFGRVKPHRVHRTRHPDHPELTVMGTGTRKADGSVDKAIFNRGGDWHTDGPWDHDVAKATCLLGLEIPSQGGDTLFANMYRAHDRLPSALRQRLAGLSAEYVYGGREQRGVELLEPEDRNQRPTCYPLLRRHSETGRTSLYFNPFHITRIVGVPQAESDALIDELTGRMVEEGREYRHRWQVGDLVIWDNRCTLHAAAGGYPIDQRRVHWRCTIME